MIVMMSLKSYSFYCSKLVSWLFFLCFDFFSTCHYCKLKLAVVHTIIYKALSW